MPQDTDTDEQQLTGTDQADESDQLGAAQQDNGGEGDQADDDGDTDPETFPREYVRELRSENARYREKA